ncbi:hypothetical protein CBLAS_0473 [Campylobacter blaseri]|uniref:Uncharacterized protein n=1 Tax=Campylobacter blaseri TaxID=2042961 RepID=A0A2P8R0H5_9BACT|nr:hypothetical protein [Campylobacter blaseri]PSM51992.1 hypothetical protein CQ405_05360 [Campylobacter blaseri]PSM53777.1 hypothetical protein CRN67_05360 [Campylobacter blaseri]QKF85669.1 hypothetical protein CBLAS_0473 [Campylobacter blaseri]
MLTSIFAFYSVKIYKIYYKKPTEFIQNIISIKDNEKLKLYVNKILAYKNNDEILDFFKKQNFKIYNQEGFTTFYFKNMILGKKYIIGIELFDNNITNVCVFTGYNAN